MKAMNVKIEHIEISSLKTLTHPDLMDKVNALVLSLVFGSGVAQLAERVTVNH